jgi:hypothetical protein
VADLYAYTPSCRGTATISLCAEEGKDCADCEAVTLKAGEPIDLLFLTDPPGEDLSDVTLSVACG